MRLQHLVLALITTSLAVSASATGSVAREAGEVERRQLILERQKSELLFQLELARPLLGERAASLLADRARCARRLEQLSLVASEGEAVLGALLEGRTDEAERLMLRSPSALLARDDGWRVQGRGTKPNASWTRGSWMDSPDGAK